MVWHVKSLPPDELRRLQIVALGLLLGPIAFLGVAVLLRVLGRPFGNVPVLGYAAGAMALVAPVLAGFVRGQMSAGFSGEPLPAEKTRASVIFPLAILEAAVFFCGIAFLLTPSYLPLAAALVPLATMLLWFPR
jgi:hypothetical protein